MLRRALLAGLIAVLSQGAAVAQEQQPATGSATIGIPSPILTIDGERLFADSAFGTALRADIEADARDLAAENRRIEAELSTEERDLTERRPTLAADEFKALADAFDQKVQRVRAEQDAKERDLNQRRDDGRQNFFSRIGPVVSDIVRERGAVIVLDRRQVFISADTIDITDEAIRRIDAALADTGTAD